MSIGQGGQELDSQYIHRNLAAAALDALHAFDARSQYFVIAFWASNKLWPLTSSSGEPGGDVSTLRYLLM